MGELQRKYSHIRRVRGDGNCFYRAIVYAYLERVIMIGVDGVRDLIELYAKIVSSECEL